MKRALLIPDTHVPFEHEKNYNLMLKVALDFKPHEIVILGDYLDCYSVSAHAKDPMLPSMLNIEIVAARERIQEFNDLFPRAKKVYIEGNHEYRLSRYIRDKAPELFELVDLPRILNLGSKWEWVSYGPEQRYSVLGSKMYARHEPIGTSSKTTATRAMQSVIFGHTHRIEENGVVAIDGTEYVSFSPGWLGDKNKPAFNFVKHHAQWQCGFALAYVDEKTDFFYHQIIRILENSTCVFNGRRYKG